MKIKKYEYIDIRCPICFENSLIYIKDYKISLKNCKNKCNINNILINQFKYTKKRTNFISFCNCCNNKIKNDTYIYKCNSCGCLCESCKSNHEQYNILNQKNNIFDIHIDYDKNDCYKYIKDLCLICNNHNIKSLENTIPKKEDIIANMNTLKNNIDIFKYNANKIIRILNNTINNLIIYYKKFNTIINNYNLEDIN